MCSGIVVTALQNQILVSNVPITSIVLGLALDIGLGKQPRDIGGPLHHQPTANAHVRFLRGTTVR